MNKLIINGLVTVEGMKFHDIEGGFGEGKKSMLVKDISDIHGREVGKVNELINNNKKRFKEGIDIIDLKANPFEGLGYKNTGYTKQSFNQSKNIYLLSERGYAKLLKILEDDVAWEQYEKLVDGYFNIREKIKSIDLELANNKIKELTDALEEFKRVTEEAKQQYKPSHKKKLDYNRMIKMITNNEEEVQVVKDWVFGILNISKWEDTCVSDSSKIMEAITAVVKLLSINKFQQLSLWDN